ncbi:hypothetical protein SCLCIDRAFT_1217833 [Scleroderma citrinum Foug A]|uniref:Uncharacterized protein n=1 Tax=Scleroderma citrinum Foug A TaxID=1036808 RepID=A0A0C3A3L2_9AGAM|nr:hypothetical protein SCLCIDRAFT_1217833 [Scleroderma citrinum Foug A]
MPAHRKGVPSSQYSSHDGKIDHMSTHCNPLISIAIRLDKKAFEQCRNGFRHEKCR